MRQLRRLSGFVGVALGLTAGVAQAIPVHGFLDNRVGIRTHATEGADRAALAESRLQGDWSFDADTVTLRLRGDMLLDPLAPSQRVDWERGQGWVDLREANVAWLLPVGEIEAKAGRQILTWGTADLLFINDLFPKDWVSFLIGRDDEYLKAPSDALKVSTFGRINVDIVYTPRFDADRFITGERTFYWSEALGRVAGEDAVIQADIPDDVFRDDEWAVRVHGVSGAAEWALYGYDGFWKSPAGMDPVRGLAVFPALRVYGASARAPVLGGLAHAETGYYDSRDDRDGTDPLTRNSEWRALAGFEREVVRNCTAAAQAYVERMRDHAAYRSGLPPGAAPRDATRSVLSLRITWLLLQQNLRLGAIALWSPSDEDVHVRPQARYAVSDRLTIEGGAALSYGREAHTFYGQFEQNNVLYSSVRYGF